MLGASGGCGRLLAEQAEQADFLSKATPVLISAMKATGVKRLLAISAGGVGDSRDKVPAAFRVFVSLGAIRYCSPPTSMSASAGRAG